MRQLAQTKGYTHIEFSRLKDLIGVSSLREENDDMAYAASAPSVRLALMHRYGNFNWDAVANESYVNNDENKRLTYCGYLKFLALDLATTYPIGPGRTKSAFKRGVEVIAKTMLRRGEAFAKAVRETYPEHVRLSIHPSTGEDKISINVLPTTNVVTPWHSAVAIQLDGTVRAGPRQIFEDDAALELVHSDGRPSYFRESSPLWTWDTPTPVTIEPIYPCGLLITPTAGPNTLSIEHIDAPKLRHLAEQNSPHHPPRLHPKHQPALFRRRRAPSARPRRGNSASSSKSGTAVPRPRASTTCSAKNACPSISTGCSKRRPRFSLMDAPRSSRSRRGSNFSPL